MRPVLEPKIAMAVDAEMVVVADVEEVVAADEIDGTNPLAREEREQGRWLSSLSLSLNKPGFLYALNVVA